MSERTSAASPLLSAHRFVAHHITAEVVMALPVPVRIDPYHGWLLRALLAVLAMLIFALTLHRA